MSETELPNPFNYAPRMVGINVLLRPDDVTSVWHNLSVERAEILLERHGASIAALMLAAGIDAAVAIIKLDERSL